MGYSANWNSTDQIPQRAVQTRPDQPLRRDRSQRRRADQPLQPVRRWRQTDGNVSRDVNVYAIRSTLTLNSNFTYFLDNPVQGDQFQQTESRTAWARRGARRWTGTWAGHEVANTVGLQLRRDRMSPVALYSTQGRSVYAVTSQDTATVTSAAPYYSNTFNGPTGCAASPACASTTRATM